MQAGNIVRGAVRTLRGVIGKDPYYREKAIARQNFLEDACPDIIPVEAPGVTVTGDDWREELNRYTSMLEESAGESDTVTADGDVEYVVWDEVVETRYFGPTADGRMFVEELEVQFRSADGTLVRTTVLQGEASVAMQFAGEVSIGGLAGVAFPVEHIGDGRVVLLTDEMERLVEGEPKMPVSGPDPIPGFA